MNTEVIDNVDTSAPDLTSTASKSSRKKKDSWPHVIKRLAIIISVGYLAILGTLAYSEHSLVYPGSKYPRGIWEPINFNHEEVDFQSEDGTRLVGWYLKKPILAPAGRPDRTVLVCHGNAENVAESAGYTGEYFRHTLIADVFVFDYRGYGKCDGRPCEAGVLADSEAALKWICNKTGKSPMDIIIVGHSLGGGPAVHLAQEYGCKALVLQRTFSSMTDTAQHSYPWLPVRFVMRNHYCSHEKIKTCDCPLYQSHGADDQLIPIELALKLFRSSPSTTKKFSEYSGMGHYDPLPLGYWYDLRDFIDTIDPPPNYRPVMHTTPMLPKGGPSPATVGHDHDHGPQK
jgi:fermentation-respiration switch protein FrsA (DUF1100 family)